MKNIKLKPASDGRYKLHIWRTGQSYARQKSPLYMAEWNNLKFCSLPAPKDDKSIIHYDVRKGLPFEDEAFDDIYAYHIVEHLSPAEVKSFTSELYRVARPGAVVRVSTPDLEETAREYLRQLGAARADMSPNNLIRYSWASMELLDQMVREAPGGEMIRNIRQGYYDLDYAGERYGDVFDEFLPVHLRTSHDADARPVPGGLKNILARLARKLILRFIKHDPRRTMEANKWLHDYLSVRLLLEGAGFTEYSQKDFRTSDISGWDAYDLDRSNYGDHAIEPSLYVEARKTRPLTKASK